MPEQSDFQDHFSAENGNKADGDNFDPSYDVSDHGDDDGDHRDGNEGHGDN